VHTYSAYIQEDSRHSAGASLRLEHFLNTPPPPELGLNAPLIPCTIHPRKIWLSTHSTGAQHAIPLRIRCTRTVMHMYTYITITPPPHLSNLLICIRPIISLLGIALSILHTGPKFLYCIYSRILFSSGHFISAQMRCFFNIFTLYI
jgi:hypothetical protein